RSTDGGYLARSKPGRPLGASAERRLDELLPSLDGHCLIPKLVANSTTDVQSRLPRLRQGALPNTFERRRAGRARVWLEASPEALQPSGGIQKPRVAVLESPQTIVRRSRSRLPTGVGRCEAGDPS